MQKKPADVMGRLRHLFHNSGLSLDELGQRMGYPSGVARKSAWQFLNKTSDPRLSMLKRFAEAMNVSLVDLVK
jgi:transcriptional regulator with XRE-family HTH domain